MAARLSLQISMAIAAAVLVSSPSHAASYSQLQAQGYKTSKMARSPGGSWGWTVSNGQKHYFCFSRGGAVQIGKDGLAVFSTAGRLIRSSRKLYEARTGDSVSSFPRYEDLMAGRPEPRSVGSCQLKR